MTIVSGEYELPHLVAQAREVATRIPGARYIELAETAHLPMLDQPAAVAELIREASSPDPTR